MSSKIQDHRSKIKKTQFLSPDIASMWLTVSKQNSFDFSPGQFLMLETPGFSLRRPFVIVDKNGDDIRIIFKLRGEGTHLLSRLSEATELKVLGPLGQAFPDPDPNTEVVLAGGGIGIVTLLPMAKYLMFRTTQRKVLLSSQIK
jgi:dihydroorotate dehydrogenase electron transfer subunit